jgi:uncharacterized membrane protein
LKQQRWLHQKTMRQVRAVVLIILGMIWIAAASIGFSMGRGETGWTTRPAPLLVQREFGAIVLVLGVALAYRAFKT